jgi:hypothetical protein
MTKEQFKAYVDKYGFQQVSEAIGKRRTQMYCMMRGARIVTESTQKLLILSFPDETR